MKFLISLALIGAVTSRYNLRQKEFVQLQFASGLGDTEIETDNINAPEVQQFYSQKGRQNRGAFTQTRSDPIKGSLGWPDVPLPDLKAEQQFEVELSKMKPRNYKDDKIEVVDTLDSLKLAEKITGQQFPDRNSPEQLKALKISPDYHLADEDDWEDDTGDSVVETRRSIQAAENSLKQRWFINAQEQRSFEEKVRKGEIRGEVLNFNNTDDADSSESHSEIEDREAEKKEKAKAKAEAQEKGEDKELTDQEKLEKEDKEARDNANKAHKAAEDLAKEEGKEEASPSGKAASHDLPPELNPEAALDKMAKNMSQKESLDMSDVGNDIVFDPYRGAMNQIKSEQSRQQKQQMHYEDLAEYE